MMKSRAKIKKITEQGNSFLYYNNYIMKNYNNKTEGK